MDGTSWLTAVWWLTLLRGAVGVLDYTDCNSKYNLESVTISGCTIAPCLLRVNSTVTVTTHFTPVRDAATLKNEVYFSLNNARVPAVARPDPCSSFTCPLRGDLHKNYTYSSDVIVQDTLPALSGELAWSLTDESGETVICFRVDIQLVMAKSSSANESEVQVIAYSHDSGNQVSLPVSSHTPSVRGQNPSGGQHNPHEDHHNPHAHQHIPPEVASNQVGSPLNQFGGPPQFPRNLHPNTLVHQRRALHKNT